MDNPNLKQLIDLYKFVKDKAISPEQLKVAVSSMMKIVKESREENKITVQAMKKTLEQTLAYIEDQHSTHMEKMGEMNKKEIKKLEKLTLDTLYEAQNALEMIKSKKIS